MAALSARTLAARAFITVLTLAALASETAFTLAVFARAAFALATLACAAACVGVIDEWAAELSTLVGTLVATDLVDFTELSASTTVAARDATFGAGASAAGRLGPATAASETRNTAATGTASDPRQVWASAATATPLTRPTATAQAIARLTRLRAARGCKGVMNFPPTRLRSQLSG